jgi:hypothetical protein
LTLQRGTSLSACHPVVIDGRVYVQCDRSDHTYNDSADAWVANNPIVAIYCIPIPGTIGELPSPRPL